jgi:hypothetical protein
MGHAYTARQFCLATFAAIIGPAISGSAADLPQRRLYAVNELPPDRGSISVYDIDAGHRLVKAIHTVSDVDDVRGVAGNASSGKLYVAYRDRSGNGMLYCLDLYKDTVLWKENPSWRRSAGEQSGRTIFVRSYLGGRNG